ncbi:unnamed protein product [Didymodactylos carnosus]|uniref:Uncharacterized protein n=1 Tax=Didymodactylos carnosus TaxID=1234261 RepID=A0A815CKY9_9BILA|nr:unnamed protein product [Didymodactylos carnosus]CAF4085276.1 unnamed protein product [Didymodactylos carnosus]
MLQRHIQSKNALRKPRGNIQTLYTNQKVPGAKTAYGPRYYNPQQQQQRQQQTMMQRFRRLFTKRDARPSTGRGRRVVLPNIGTGGRIAAASQIKKRASVSRTEKAASASKIEKSASAVKIEKSADASKIEKSASAVKIEKSASASKTEKSASDNNDMVETN